MVLLLKVDRRLDVSPSGLDSQLAPRHGVPSASVATNRSPIDQGRGEPGLEENARMAPDQALLRFLLHEPPQIHGVSVTRVDVAIIIDTDALKRAKGLGFLDETRDLAVPGVADADALLEARIGLFTRLRVGHVDRILLVDPDAAGPAELLPFGQELAVLIENLNPVVGAVGHKQAA